MRISVTPPPALPGAAADAADATHATDYLQPADYARIVYRRRWLVLAIVAVGLGAALYLNATTAPVFEAQATLQIDAEINVLGVDRPLIPTADWMREYLPTQLGILQSRELARLAHEELNGAGGIRDYVAPAPDLGDGPVPTVQQIVAGRSVGAVRDTRLVNVRFRDTDPATTARVANALARAYVHQNIEFRSSASADASDWLLRQVAEQRKLVADSEAALQRYREERGADALFTDKLGVEQQNIVVQRLSELQGAVTRARTETIEKEALYRQLQGAGQNGESLDSIPPIASNPYIQGLKSELATLQRQLVQASKEFGDRHPEIIKLTGAVQATERKLQTEISNIAGVIRNDYEGARAREQALTRDLERQRLEVQALNGKAVEYTALEREANSNREVLDNLLQRAREAGLARQLESTNVRIVDWAEIPVAPILPRRERNILLALFGSSAIALALAFSLEIFNRRFRSPADVRRHLRIPVLGVLPRVEARSHRGAILISDHPGPQFAALFQGLRTAIVSTHSLAGRTLLVTSSEPGEGKTVTATNLAISLARLNQRVLLIDADLRRPRLHEVFGEEQQPGLADALTGTSIGGHFRKTKVPGLWLLPAGKASRNPADLLGSQYFGKLADGLRTHFDWLIIDSPPVLAVTDACLIARVASDVLLVLDSGRTPRQTAAAAVERLSVVEAPVVGAVLNRAVLDRRDESYLPYYDWEYEGYDPPAVDDGWTPQGSIVSAPPDSETVRSSTLKA